jgi:IS605 OrfB family transposase
MGLKTYNIKINGEQGFKEFWVQLLTETTNAYNHCANVICEQKTPLTITAVHAACYEKIRNTFKSLPAQAVIRIQKEVLRAFRSQKSNGHKQAKTPQKHNLSMTLDKRMYSSFTWEGISIVSETPNKRKRFTFNLYPKIKEMFNTSIAKDPVIFYRNNELWLSIPFEVQGKMPCNNNCIGVDMGIKRLFTTSDGIAFRDKNYLTRRRKLRYLKRTLESVGTRSANKHLYKLRKKERKLSKDMCHRATNALLKSTDASVIVVEDLSNIKKSTSKSANGFKRTRHNNMLSQVPFYMFKEILTYKATLAGKQVVSVSPQYTSQIDSRTGKKDGKRLGCRYYCSDGVVLDADWNASVNIAKKCKHPLTNKLPIDGGLMFLNGRGTSTSQSSNAHGIMTSTLL